MDRSIFERSPTGSLVKIAGTDARTGEYEHVAFQPYPLGEEEPNLAGTTWRAVAAAGTELGRLGQAGRQIPDPTLLRQPTLRAEAQSTSALEGTFAPLEDVLAADLTEPGARSASLREVLNYVEAAETAFAWLQEGRPLSTASLSSVHEILVQGTPADTREAGRVRRIQVAIGSHGGHISTARFVPPPPGMELDAAFRDLLDWLNGPSRMLDPVVAAAMAHYQFETLHPFNDGNGRIGRLLVVLQLLARGALPQPPLLTISPWFEARRDSYQDRLRAVSAVGDWDGWVGFFADGLADSCRRTVRTVTDLLALEAAYLDRIRAAGLSGALIRDITAQLIGNPFVTAASVARATGKTTAGARNAIGQLIGLGVLRERTTRSYARVYEAVEVFQILQRP
ncbi:Fic family protein [Frankia sp. AgPm24]|uniref:Fic family protein n=1 Tax=Frankia sp. AgPm24 TaxID=631128 RepID=UPI00200D3204|nr:Fic/DOC family N-terminal domain-containing protein [Frankia sp. AgPm24]MCK9922954.1 Fic family protein [Frankia sp. AgPm24]